MKCSLCGAPNACPAGPKQAFCEECRKRAGFPVRGSDTEPLASHWLALALANVQSALVSTRVQSGHLSRYAVETLENLIAVAIEGARRLPEIKDTMESSAPGSLNRWQEDLAHAIAGCRRPRPWWDSWGTEFSAGGNRICRIYCAGCEQVTSFEPDTMPTDACPRCGVESRP